MKNPAACLYNGYRAYWDAREVFKPKWQELTVEEQQSWWAALRSLHDTKRAPSETADHNAKGGGSDHLTGPVQNTQP